MPAPSNGPTSDFQQVANTEHTPPDFSASAHLLSLVEWHKELKAGGDVLNEGFTKTVEDMIKTTAALLIGRGYQA